MTKKYRYEPFESFKEALEWVKQDRPIFKDGKKVDSPLYDTWTCELIDEWQSWKKAIEIKPEVKRYWRWRIDSNNGWRSSEYYLDDMGLKPNGKKYSFWEEVEKQKIEHDFIDIDQDGNLVEVVDAN